MIPYTPSEAFTDSDIYDLSDFVIGGDAGTSNVPLKALLDRSIYLRNRLARFEDVKILTGTYSFDAVADARKMFAVHVSANTTFNLPDVTSVPTGYIIPISTIITAIKALTVKCFGSQVIKDGADDVTEMYMHDAERLWLIAAGSYWEVLMADGNFKVAGDSYSGRKQKKNSFIRKGDLVNRADVPRLSAVALSLNPGQGIVTDATWGSDPGGLPYYRGCFSNGNGSTTIRIPDDRGMFIRMMDLGRGVDNDRYHAYAGGFQPDAVKNHYHDVDPNPNANSASGLGKITTGGDAVEGTLPIIKSSGPKDPTTNLTIGAVETRGMNTGEIPFIYY